MKTRYRFIHFKQAQDLWVCFNNKTNDPLCSLEYYAPWKQWVLAAKSPTSVFSADCLTNIAHFLNAADQAQPPREPKS